MELHTIGVDAGYTQADVERGGPLLHRLDDRRPSRGRTATSCSAPTTTTTGPKTVLGNAIPAGAGVGHGERVLDILAAHPATRHLHRHQALRPLRRRRAARLGGRKAVAATFTATGGDLRETMRTILLSAEFRAAADQKFKRPWSCSSSPPSARWRRQPAADGIHKPLLGAAPQHGAAPLRLAGAERLPRRGRRLGEHQRPAHRLEPRPRPGRQSPATACTSDLAASSPALRLAAADPGAPHRPPDGPPALRAARSAPTAPSSLAYAAGGRPPQIPPWSPAAQASSPAWSPSSSIPLTSSGGERERTRHDNLLPPQLPPRPGRSPASPSPPGSPGSPSPPPASAAARHAGLRLPARRRRRPQRRGPLRRRATTTTNRPTLGITEPGGRRRRRSTSTASSASIRRSAPLKELYDDGGLAVVHAAGSPDDTHSHFDGDGLHGARHPRRAGR